MARSARRSRRFRIPSARPLRIGIAAKIAAPETPETVRGLLGWLARLGAETAVEEQLAKAVGSPEKGVPLAEIGSEQDFVLLLGGDGTLLSVARAMGEEQRPIFGVNLGSLGFLTHATVKNLYPGLEQILAGGGIVEERSTLAARLIRDGSEVLRQLAVNDVVITGGAIARVIGVRVTTAHGFVANVRGDGVIVATPTGSTAYNLGAGGPVVHPAVGAIILAPIVPLTLTQRPVVFPDSEELSLTVRTRRREVHVTFDGQSSGRLGPGDVIRVGKSPFPLQMLGLAEQDYFRVLRKKLLWSALPPKRARTTPPTPPPG